MVNTYCSLVTMQGRGNGQLYSPSGITVHNERLYIAEYSNSRISVFQLMVNFVALLGQDS